MNNLEKIINEAWDKKDQINLLYISLRILVGLKHKTRVILNAMPHR